MGHRLGDSSTYVRYYMTNFIDADTQSIVFGSKLQSDLVHLMGRLLRHGQAPTELTEQQKDEIYSDPDLVELRSERDKALARIKEWGYATSKDAKESLVGEQYEECKRKINNLRNKLTTSRLNKEIEEFHESIHAEEVDRQLHTTTLSNELVTQATEHELPERRDAAHLFSKAATASSTDGIDLLRIELVNTLARLCKRRESPHTHQGNKRLKSRRTTIPDQALSIDRRGKKEHTSSISRVSSFSCPFCQIDCEVGKAYQVKVWRIDGLAKHIRKTHIQDAADLVSCPYDNCWAILGGREPFANHAARKHGLNLQKAFVAPAQEGGRIMYG